MLLSLQFSQHFMELWQLFQPKLSEPSIAMLHNKQVRIDINMQLWTSKLNLETDSETDSFGAERNILLSTLAELSGHVFKLFVAGSTDLLAQGMCRLPREREAYSQQPDGHQVYSSQLHSVSTCSGFFTWLAND